MRLVALPMVLWLSLGCTSRGTVIHEPDEGSSMGASSTPRDMGADEASTPSAAAPSVEEPVSWFEPLPPLTLVTPTEEQKVRIRSCMEMHRVQEPDVAAHELMAAATCLGDIPLPGHEIRIYRHLLQTQPDALETMEATRALGERYEQIDVRPQAIDAYVSYLRRFPTQADARALGQRAVCLARSLGADDRAIELLTTLEQLYGRRGFVRPDDPALEQLCAAVPPVSVGPVH